MISFNSLKNEFVLEKTERLRAWLKVVIKSEKKKPGDIQFIFCDDNYLHEMNKDFLNHDTLTDIITFPSSTNKSVISGEIYISIDRVKENAGAVNVSFNKELSRVLVHGVLHLTGYDDHSPDEKKQMRGKEDYYLNLHP